MITKILAEFRIQLPDFFELLQWSLIFAVVLTDVTKIEWYKLWSILALYHTVLTFLYDPTIDKD